MTTNTDAITFRELLDYTSIETERWHQWFLAHPEALDLSYGDTPLATARDVVRHVAFVEQRYAAILLGHAVPSAEGSDADDAATLFAYVADGRIKLEAAIAATDEAGLARQVEFMTLTAGLQQRSARKIIAHALLHGVRHYAQLATVLRMRGAKTDWAHDLLVSPVMEG